MRVLRAVIFVTISPICYLLNQLRNKPDVQRGVIIVYNFVTFGIIRLQGILLNSFNAAVADEERVERLATFIAGRCFSCDILNFLLRT